MARRLARTAADHDEVVTLSDDDEEEEEEYESDADDDDYVDEDSDQDDRKAATTTRLTTTKTKTKTVVQKTVTTVTTITKTTTTTSMRQSKAAEVAPVVAKAKQKQSASPKNSRAAKKARKSNQEINVNMVDDYGSYQHGRRRSRRGNSCLSDLAKAIVLDRLNVVVITGAGVSVASGVRPFRGSSTPDVKVTKDNTPGTSGIWTEVIWTMATRESFRKDPLRWYNDFWLPYFAIYEPKTSAWGNSKEQVQQDGGEGKKAVGTTKVDEQDEDNGKTSGADSQKSSAVSAPQPNEGHIALAQLMERYSNVNLITQNIDGLHAPSDRLIEAHGKLGLYRCLPDSDSDTDSDSDDDDDRPVHLGHRRKRRMHLKDKNRCIYQQESTLTADLLLPKEVGKALACGDVAIEASDDEEFPSAPPLRSNAQATSRPGNIKGGEEEIEDEGPSHRFVSEPPRCPSCSNFAVPLSLLFDEGYHSHDHYNFVQMEDWLANADRIVFVGTSFAVTLTEAALSHARDRSLPVYNFNTDDWLESSLRLDAENIAGPSQETLPRLLEACIILETALKQI